MKPTIVADEMFPEGTNPFMDMDEAGGSSGLLMDLAANEKDVHADFFNDFEDLYDEDELQPPPAPLVQQQPQQQQQQQQPQQPQS